MVKVDHKLTASKFGYDPVEIEPDANTNVYVFCDQCNESFVRPYALIPLPHTCKNNIYTAHRPRTPPRLECKILHKYAKLPSRNRYTDSGYDLYSVQSVIISPGVIETINTGLAVSAPPGYYYTINGRSSLWKHGLLPFRAIIDATYTGELIIKLMNTSSQNYNINVGDRIAQITVHEIIHADFTIVDDFSAEYDQRGNLGFGSSGK